MEYIVTDIKELTRKKKLIYLNYEPVFPLYIGELRKYNIQEQQTVDEALYTELMKNIGKRAVLRAMNLLKNRDYTEKQLSDKLKQSYYPESVIDAALKYVESYGYVDDERYAYNFISMRSGSKSRKYIKQQLIGKGIDSSVIERAFDKYYSDNDDKEADILREAVNKKICSKYGSERHEFSYEDKQKMMASFYRKGFSMELIKKVFNTLQEQLN